MFRGPERGPSQFRLHLKNFSLITRVGRNELSPAYDLLNSTIALPDAQEEMALPLRGRRRNLTAKDLIEYYGRERLDLEVRAIDDVLAAVADAYPAWERMIGESFLPDDLRGAYRAVLEERKERLGL